MTALKGCDDPLFLDFMKQCMEWDPADRMTPGQALKHPWLKRRLPKSMQDEGSQTAAKRASATRAALSKLQSGASTKSRQIGPISGDVKFNTRTKLPQIGSTM